MAALPRVARPWAGPLAWMLSLAACYGVLALLPLLSVLGMSSSPNGLAWAAVILAFALLAAASAAAGRRRHGRAWPAGLAAAATLLLAWVMLVRFDPVLEWLGFGVLGVAVFADALLKRRAGCR